MIRLDQKLLKVAMSYPFSRSHESFIFVNGTVEYLESYEKNKINAFLSSIDASSIQYRVPVLAYGANASPERLKLKYSQLSSAVFPVVKAKLIDFDIVFASHYSSYGSIPATLKHSPRTTVDLFVTFLEEGQLELMHQSELPGKRYVFGALNNIKVQLDGDEMLNSAFSYWAVCGHYSDIGQAIALSDVPAEDRRLKSWTQENMQSKARDHLDPDRSLTQFILEHLKSETLLRKHSDKLNSFAKPFNYKSYRILRR